MKSPWHRKPLPFKQEFYSTDDRTWTCPWCSFVCCFPPQAAQNLHFNKCSRYSKQHLTYPKTKVQK